MSINANAAVRQRMTDVARQLVGALYCDTLDEALLLLASRLRHEAHVATLMPLRDELEFLRLRLADLEKNK